MAVLLVVAGGFAAPVVAQSATVTVSDQGVDMTAEVIVDDASLPNGGFLALYQGSNQSGELIGHTGYLDPGQYRDIAVPFDDRFYYTDSGTTHSVVAYEDTDGDGEFEPTVAIASDSFVIEFIVTPTAAPETASPTPSPDGDSGADDPTATPTVRATDTPAENALTADQPGGGPPLWLVGAGVLGLVAVGAGLRRRGDGGDDSRDGPGGTGDTGDGTGTAGGSAPAATPVDSADEARIEGMLESNDGRMKQATIVEETGWSEAKVSTLLSEMEDDGRVSKLRLGRETLITLPDGDPGDDLAGAGDASPAEAPTAGATVEADDATGGDDNTGSDADTGDGPGTPGGNWRESVPTSVPGAPVHSVDYADLDIGEFVGGGGSADVHRATIGTADGPVAVKRPRARGTLHTEQVERFVEEAETWAKLDDHDGVVDVVGWGSEPLPWLAMEFMDGGHLGERAGEVALAEGLWTAVTIAQAVRHAHRRGVAHLDLKPENVLYRETAEGWDAPKVADWGLSKHLIEHSASVDGMTPGYAAPEQFDDDYGAADDITDVYGLGAVCYELFTGRPPFEGRPSEVMNAVLTETPAPPSEHDPSLPSALDEVLLTALATEKADRYESVLYLRDDLQDLLNGL